MILLDRSDVLNLGMDKGGYPFHVFWDPTDPVLWARGNKIDFPEILADGPFVCVVTDEYVWAGQRADRLQPVAQKRADSINLKQWRYVADLYAAEMGVSRQSMILRFSSVRRQLRETPDEWRPWGEVYDWPQGGDLMWSAIVYGRHPWIKAREHKGQRQVRFIRNG